MQLTETADAIELFARSSSETLEKQRRLLTSTYETLMDARMQYGSVKPFFLPLHPLHPLLPLLASTDKFP